MTTKYKPLQVWMDRRKEDLDKAGFYSTYKKTILRGIEADAKRIEELETKLRDAAMNELAALGQAQEAYEKVTELEAELKNKKRPDVILDDNYSSLELKVKNAIFGNYRDWKIDRDWIIDRDLGSLIIFLFNIANRVDASRLLLSEMKMLKRINDNLKGGKDE